MRVTLVNPHYSFWKPDTQYLKRVLGQLAPLGLLSLAAYVRKHMPDAQIHIVDAAAHDLSHAQAAERIRETRPHVVGITLTTMAARNAHAIAQAVKAALPRVTIIAGGPHVSGTGEEALQSAPAFDLGAVGEGEQTFLEVLQAIGDHRPIHAIPGLLYRDRQGVPRRTPPRAAIKDLDSLPRPAWDLLPGFPRLYGPNVFFSPCGPVANLVTSRGCPFRCNFCDQSTFGHTYRAISAERAFEMVRVLQKKYGIRYIVFADDTFTLDRSRVLRLCTLLRTLRRTPAWSCDANVTTVDREMLLAMKKAGCWSISYGLESGSQRILDSLNKRISVARSREAVRITHALGIRAKGLFIIGAPEESAETIRETRAFMRALPLSTMNLSKFTPYPGSALYQQVADRVSLDLDRLNGMHFVAPSKYLSIEQLQREYDLTLHDFFSTRQSWATHLPIMLGSWGNIRKLIGIIPDAIRAGKPRSGNGPGPENP